MLEIMLLTVAIVLGILAIGAYKFQKVGKKIQFTQGAKIIKQIEKEK